ncbi:outer membrane beta-barrel protein [Chitinophaga sp.]|uniref:outer membrane beta-barrel protein n=1 Tax=Chitinophaga sp. TaxID=1869181 RepID=UPI0031D8526A
MKISSLIIFFLTFVIKVNALSIIIRGILQDADTKEAIPGVTMQVHIKGRLLTQAMSDAQGRFTVTANADSGDTLYIQLSHTAYTVTTIKHVVSGDEADLGIVYLKSGSRQLNVVDVKDSRLVQSVAGGYKVNTSALLIGQAGDATMLLNQVPGVQVDENGGVTARGANMAVYIDGRPTNLTGPMLQSFLRSTQGQNIESVTVYTDPPARFEAAGGGGIIDIRMRKDRRKGFTGNFGAGYSDLPAAEGSLGLNYVTSKLRIYMNGSINYREGRTHNENRLIYKNAKPDSTYFRQEEQTHQYTHSNFVSIGVDYDLDSLQTLGMNFKNIYYYGGYPKQLVNDRTDAKEQVFDFYRQTNDNVVNNKFWLADINYRKQSKKRDKELTVDVNYGKYHPYTLIDFAQQYSGQDTVRKQQNTTGQYFNLFTFATDYSWKINDRTRFEAGAKAGITKTDNRYNVIEYNNSMDTYLRNEMLSDSLLYKEQIAGVYATISRSSKKIYYSLAMRLEDTHYRLNSKDGRSFSRNYLSLFPNLYLRFNLRESQELEFYVNRRIERPSYMYLNPFINNVNPQEISFGNPYLLPAYTYKFQTYYNRYFNNNQSITLSAYVRYIDQIISETVLPDPVNPTIMNRSYGNFQKGIAVGADLSLEKQIMKGVTSSWYASVRRTQYSFEKSTTTLGVPAPITTFNGSGRITWKINKMLTTQVSGNYNSPYNSFQTKLFSSASVNALLQAQVAKPLSVTVSIYDIFRTTRGYSELNNNSLYAMYRGTWASRFIALKVNYSFGTSPFRYKKRVEVQSNDRIGI